MKRVELELEHIYKSRFVGRHRVRVTEDITVLGSSRDADIRLLGDDVGGVHALIEFTNNVWTISDAGSEQGTWVKKKPIVMHEIKQATTIRIGGHDIKITPKTIESDLFKVSKKETSKPLGQDKYQQVIIRRKGFVVHSELVAAGETYTFRHGTKDHVLSAPKDAEWKSQKFDGEVEVQQRIVNTKHMEEDFKDRVKQGWDPSLKAPAMAAILLLLLVFGLVTLAPEKPEDELIALKPEKNRYTRMIFDASSVRKKRAQSQKQRKNIVAKKSSQSQGKRTSQKVATRVKGKTPKVVSKIKASGLSRLLGKISKRAAKTAHFVQATGQSPDSRATGKVLATTSSMNGSGKTTGQGGKTFKVSGVGTSGRAGGNTGSLKGAGGLSTGNVGNASVGVIEEETEIQGGLDREVISRIINSHLGQIRYCYERQLSAAPDLYGKVMVRFTIGGTGTVMAQAVGLTTLNSAMVEGCILRRIAGWQFPKPKGGTNVLVTYPFLFKSTN